MKPRLRDAIDRALAGAREMAEPDDQAAVRRWATAGPPPHRNAIPGRRTFTRWRNHGSPEGRAYVAYMERSGDAIAEGEVMRVIGIAIQLQHLSPPELEERYWDIRHVTCDAENDDRKDDLDLHNSWADRARSSLRDARWDSEKAALELLLEASGRTVAEVLGGSR